MTRTLAATALAVLAISLSACTGSDSEEPAGSSSTATATATPTAAGTATTEAATPTTAPATGTPQERAAAAISDLLVTSQQSGGATALLAVDRKDADCIGQGFVDEIGIEKLQTYGLLDAELAANKNVDALKMNAADARSAAEVTVGCTDIKSTIEQGIDQTGTLPARTKRCISRALDVKVIQTALSSAFEGKQTEAQRLLTAPLLTCAKSATAGN